MLSEIGSVISIKADIAQVAIGREKKCVGCRHCISGMDGKYMIASALNDKQASIGDRVLIESKEINQISDGFLLFILPIILLLVSLILGTSITPLSGILTGFESLSALFLYFKLNKKHYQMQIIKIILDDHSSEPLKKFSLNGGIL